MKEPPTAMTNLSITTNLQNQETISRRSVLRAGSAAVAGLALGGVSLLAQKKRPYRVDAHAHVWTEIGRASCRERVYENV
jgi:hypothetical protein